jgi:hypothetical protein
VLQFCKSLGNHGVYHKSIKYFPITKTLKNTIRNQIGFSVSYPEKEKQGDKKVVAAPELSKKVNQQRQKLAWEIATSS